MRCAECRVGLARCANTGLSMLVDPYGRVTQSTGLFERAVLEGCVMIGSGETPYVKGGYMIDLMWIILPVGLAAASYLPRVRRKTAGPPFDKEPPAVI
jgi:apolipoprotein N-acyltransferase